MMEEGRGVHDAEIEGGQNTQEVDRRSPAARRERGGGAEWKEKEKKCAFGDKVKEGSGGRWAVGGGGGGGHNEQSAAKKKKKKNRLHGNGKKDHARAAEVSLQRGLPGERASTHTLVSEEKGGEKGGKLFVFPALRPSRQRRCVRLMR